MHEPYFESNSEFLWFRLQRNAALSKRPDGKFIGRQERRLISKLRIVWDAQLAYILDKMKKVPAFRQENVISPNALEDDIDRITNNLPWNDTMVEEILFYMRGSMEKGGNSSVKKLKLTQFGISFDLKNQKAIDFLNAKKNLELSNKSGNIHSTTKDAINKILLDAAKSGQSYQETAKLIMEQGEAGVFSPARAQLIATREIGVAYETGNNIPVKDFQEKYPDRPIKKWWRTVGDDKVTPECQENQDVSDDSGGLELDAFFPSGDLTAPRAGNPRCRCHTEYEIQ